MFLVRITEPGGETRVLPVREKSAKVGKGNDCEVKLTGWRVGREHARIFRTSGGLVIEDLGHLTGTWINGNRIVHHGPLTLGDEIMIAGYKLRVEDKKDAVSLKAAMESTAAPFTAEVADRKLGGVALASPVAPPPAARATVAAHPAATSPTAERLRIQVRFQWRRRIHSRLLEIIDLRRRDFTRMKDEEIRGETEELIREIIAKEADLPADIDRATLQREVLNEAVGLGPLEELLEDDSVTEIMVNRNDEVYVERGGRLVLHETGFSSDRAVMGVIERIVAPLGRRIDESSPLVDARLKDGSRVNAIIPPLALKGPTLTIRKFSKRRLSAEDLVGFGSISPDMAEFLRICVEYRKNIIVSGGTGSGKTTFLNVLSNFIPDGERIVTIEDAAELKLNHSHLVSLESRPSNIEGRGAVLIRDLVRNALRMRPDRIVVGECRGGEALDMLQAMNTGHEGSLTTLHANTPRDAMARLETLVLMAGMDLPLTAIRDQIASAIDIIVQQTRYACGSRKISSITEITGMENGRMQLQEIFKFDHKGYGEDGKVMGRFVATENIPHFYEELRSQGVELDMKIFGGPGAQREPRRGEEEGEGIGARAA